MKKIYTDGSCKKNPGRGGWAFIILNEQEEVINKSFGSEAETTNQKMELKAVIESLKKIEKDEEVEVHSDSAYVVNCFLEGWMEDWKENGWKNSAKKSVANQELWKELDLLMQGKNVLFKKVKGHGNDKNNQLVDKLASDATKMIK